MREKIRQFVKSPYFRLVPVGLLIVFVSSCLVFNGKKVALDIPKSALASYQYAPTGGTLVTGTEQDITSATAASSEGVNVGSWKGTLASDDFAWVVGSTASGYDANLKVGGVKLNGANMMMIDTDLDLDATAPSTYIQICDWKLATGVDNAADSQCTNGGWRTLNNRKATITSTSPVAYHYQIYNGFWGDGATNYETPLVNFINDSKEVKVRYYSTTNTTSTVAIDYLRIATVINPVYSPSKVTNLNANAGVVTGATTSKYAYASAKDNNYLYTCGDDSSSYLRIEKRLLSNGSLVNGFGTAGVVTGASTSRNCSTIEVDSTYMYVAGSDSSFDWRVEKRLLSDGSLVSGFGTGGVVTSDSTSKSVGGMVIDGNYLYFVGSNSDNNWRIEKRLLSDGSLVSGFGTSGIATGATETDSARAIDIDSTYMYVAGYDESADWRIEKRLLSDGSLVSGFGTGGVVTGDSSTQFVGKILIDTSNIYLIGTNSSSDWRIEKRLISDGSLVSGFGTGGVVTGATDSVFPYGLCIDSTYMYIAGYNTSEWRIEKRLLSDGSLVSGFGTGGVVTGDSVSDYCFDLLITNNDMYAIGYDSNYDWRTEKRKLSDGSYDVDSGFGLANGTYESTKIVFNDNNFTASDDTRMGMAGTSSSIADYYYSFKNVKTYTGMNTILARSEYSCSATGINFRPKIYNFNSSSWEDLTTGNIACSTSDATNAWAKNNVTMSNYMQNGEIRVGFYGLANGTQEIRNDLIYLMLGTTNTDSATSNCFISFGTNSANNCEQTRDLDMTASSSNTWNIATVDESNTFSSDFYPSDVDMDGTVEEGAASHVKFSVSQPANSVVTGTFFAGRYMSGTGGSVMPSLRDYSGTTATTGGFTDIGNSATTALYYSDNITVSITRGGTVNTGVNGTFTTPNQYLNTATNEMWMRLRTSTSGATSNNSVNQWDFAMTSLQWIEDSEHPTTTYQFTPTGGNLVTGTAQNILAATATNSEGVNVGSWKGTLANDDFHWAVASTSGGYDMNLTVDNVELNGANSLTVQTEIDEDATAPSTLFQICDWVTATSVDAVADAQCTGGGWRTLNPNKTGTAPTGATSYSFQVYDGYWSNGTNTAIDTPLTNFLNSGQVKIRYYSSTNTTSVVAIDYLRIYATINPVYQPAGFTNISATGATSGDYKAAQFGIATGSALYGSDDARMGGTGQSGYSVADMYWSFKNMVTYSGMNAFSVRAETSCSTTGLNYKPKIYNFTTASWEDLTTGSIACSTTDMINSWAKGNITISDYISSGEMRIGLYGLAQSGGIIRADYIYVTLGSTVTSTDQCEITFGTNNSGDCTATQNMDNTGTQTTWKISKEDESTDFSHDYYPYDNDADVDVEAAAAAQFKFDATAPTGSGVTGIFYNFAYAAGAGYSSANTGTVVGNVYDYSGYNTTGGGFINVPILGQAYGSQLGAVGSFILNDNVTPISTSNGSIAGFNLNPEDFYDAANNKLLFRVRTSTDGVAGTGTSIPAEIDFAMASMQWVNSADTSGTPGGIIDGTVYTSDAKTTTIGAGKTVALSINGGSTTTVETDGSGYFAFNNVTITADDTITLFLDDETEKANLITQAKNNYSNIHEADLVTSEVILSHETDGPMSNALLSTADNCADSDLLYTISTNDVAFTANYKVTIDSGKTYTPGGNVDLTDIYLKDGSTFAPQANAVTIDGNWTADAGTIVNGTGGTITFDKATGTQTIDGGEDDATYVFNLVHSGAGTLQISTHSLDINDFNNSGGTFDTNSLGLTVGGDFANSATLTTTSTITFNKAAGTQTLNSGGVGTGKAFYNLTHSGAGTLQFITNNVDIDNNLVNSAGTLDVNGKNINVGKDWNNSANITNNTGTVTMDGDGKTGTITSGGSSFGNLVVDNGAYTPVTDGLAGYWRLDEGTGTSTADASGNNNTGTLTGPTHLPTWTSSVKDASYFGGDPYGVTLDGVDDTINIGDVLDMGTSDMTIVTWVKTSTIDSINNKYIVSKSVAANFSNRYAFGLGNGKFRGYFRGNITGDISFNGSTTIADGTWHMGTLVYDRDGNMSLYVDNNSTPDGSQSIAVEAATNFQTDFNLRLGSYGNADGTPGFFFPGLVDDVRIYNRALTTSEIATIYNGEITSIDPSTYSLVDDIDINGDFDLKNGEFSPGSNDISIAGDMTIDNGATYTKGTGTLTFDGTTASSITDSNTTKQDLGAVVINKTDTTDPDVNNVTSLGSSIAVSNLSVDGTLLSEDYLNLGTLGSYILTVNDGGTTTVGANGEILGSNILSLLDTAGANLATTGTLSSKVRFDATTTKAATVPARTYGGTVELFSSATDGDATITLGAGTHNYSSNFNPMANGTSHVIVDASVNNPTINITGNMQYNGTNATGRETMKLGSGTWTISGNWDTSLADWGHIITRGTSTLVMNGSSKTLAVTTNEIYTNITISNNITYASSSGLTIAGTLTVDNGYTFTVNTSLSMYAGNGHLTLNGDLTGSGTVSFQESTGSYLTGSGALSIANVAFMAVNNPNQVPARSYNNVALSAGNSTGVDRAIVFGNASSQTVTINGNLSLSTSGTNNVVLEASTYNPTINISGNITNSTTSTGARKVKMGSGTWSVGGNINLDGATVTAGTSTLALTGVNQTLTGTQTYYNLYKADNTDDSTDRILTIDDATTITIASGGTFTLDGYDDDDRVNVVSDAPGTAWELILNGSAAINYADIADSDASGGTQVDASDGTNVDGDGNTNWNFGGTGISIGGSCKAFDQSTNCTDSQTVKVAINGTLAGQTAATSSGTFAISNVSVNSGDIVTVFIDGVADTNEANAVTKYDGTGDISGILLYAEHLTIGSDDNQTLTNADLSNYDNSVSTDEDVFFNVDANNDLTVDATSQSTQERLYIKTGNTFRPDSVSSGNVTTHHMQIVGTVTADGNTFTASGDWNHSAGTFTYGTSTVDLTGTGTIYGASGEGLAFYKVNMATSTKTTTVSSTIKITNVLTLGSGNLTGGIILLQPSSGTPLVTSGATITSNIINYYASGNVNVAATTYSTIYINMTNSATATLLGDISASNLRTQGNNTSRPTLDANGYNITANSVDVGWTNTARSSTVNMKTGTLNVSGNLTIYASDSSNENLLTFTSGTLNVGGNFTNNDVFTPGSSTVKMTGTGTSGTIKTNGSSFNNLQLNNGLAGYWKLDEGTGTTAADVSGNGNDGTLTGATHLPTWSTSVKDTGYYGKNPGTVDFDGSDDHIIASDMAATSTATYSFWVKRGATLGTLQGLLSKGGNTEYAPYEIVWNTDNKLYFLQSQEGSAWQTLILSSTAVTDSNWHLVTAVNNGTTATLYIDNTSVGTDTSPATSAWDNATEVTIGVEKKPSNGALGRYFDGMIDDVRIYNRALSSTEISELYAGTNPVEGTYTLQDGLDVNGNLAIQTGKLDVSSSNYNVNVAGNLSNVGNYDARANTTDFDGASTSTLSNYSVFNNLTHSGAGTLQLHDSANIDGNFTHSAGIFDSNSQNMNVAGNFSLSDSTTFTKGGTLTFDGTTAATITDSNSTLQDLGTVVINKTDTSDPDVNNVTSLGSSITMSNLSVDGTLLSEDYLNLGTLGSYILTVNAGGTTTIGANGSIYGSNTLRLLDTAGANLGTTGTLSSKVRFDATTTKAATVPARTYGGIVELFSSAADGDATITLGAGTHNYSSDFNPMANGTSHVIIDASVNNPTINITGNMQYAGTNATGRETMKMGSGTWTVSGNWNTSLADWAHIITRGSSTVVMNGSSKTFAVTTNEVYTNIKISNNISYASSSGLTIYGTLTVDAGYTFTANTSLSMYAGNGHLTLNGDLAGSGTITFQESTGQYLTGSGALSIANVAFLAVNNPNQVPARSYNNMALSAGNSSGVDRAIVFGNASSQTITINGNLSISTSGTNNVVLEASTYNPTINISGNITNSTTSTGARKVNMGSGTWSVGGNIDFNGATVTAGTSTLKMTGTGTSGTFKSGSNSLNNIQLNNGLTGYWKLDEGTGTTAADVSGNGNDGTLTNFPASPWTSSVKDSTYYGKNPNALTFGGTDDHIVIDDDASLRPSYITASAWIYKTGDGGNQRIISKAYNEGSWNNPYLQYEILLDSGNNPTFYFNIDDTTYRQLPSNYTINNSQWYLVTATYDGTTARIYVDGSEKNTLNLTGSLRYTNSTPLHIGWRTAATSGSDVFNGNIDDVRIYNRALSSTEISELYAGTNPVEGTYTLQDALDVNGNLAIQTGKLDVSTSNYNVNVAGNFSNVGNYDARSNTTTLDSTTAATISGSSTFNNLVMNTTTDGAKQINFTNGTTQTVNGTWTLDGDTSKVLTLRSSTTDSPWYFDLPSGMTSGDYIDVQDSYSADTNKITPGANVTDNGNNEGWIFNVAPDVPATLAQKKTTDAVITTGGWNNDDAIKFTAQATDTDSSDTLYLCIEKDALGTAFSDTEDSCGSGVAYSGSGVTVTNTIDNITDATEYHWQARVKDAAGEYSDWVSYGANLETASDFGIDTTAPTGGAVSDGTSGDEDWNDGSLDELSANWTFDSNASGINKYEYAIRRLADDYYFNSTSGAWQSESVWTDNGTTAFVTISPIILQTGVSYYTQVRATDNAGNTTSNISSDGFQVRPTLSFAISSNEINFSALNASNNYEDTKSHSITTSTNASNGYVVYAYIDQLLTSTSNASRTIDNFIGTWLAPASWNSGTYGFGYSSSDDDIQGTDRFSSGTKFAGFSQTPPGDIVADHDEPIDGTTGEVIDESFTINYKLAVSSFQASAVYKTNVRYIIAPQF